MSKSLKRDHSNRNATEQNFTKVFILKDPSQPPPFSMPSKLLILHGEAKSYCFTVSYIPENMFHYLQ